MSDKLTRKNSINSTQTGSYSIASSISSIGSKTILKAKSKLQSFKTGPSKDDSEDSPAAKEASLPKLTSERDKATVYLSLR
ncbi:uncharacterized protein PRCAT00006233001 [Priceomyces carsonii]|uniref:uncharacterized protein n=1 Tax=Priceomyces carsonii TaxID=28549 RepID=UPI002ED7A4F3|nr:unnamed protein product [Priceomyces carsonii]